jgi:beta-lactamase superfamily II metal-dependent hydrolase
MTDTKNTARNTLIPTDTTIVVRVVFLYVGQGSSILVLFRENGKYKSLLVDSNLDRKASGIDVPKLMKDLLNGDALHAFVNTHPHDDHLNGIKELSEAVTISEVWHSDHKPGKKAGDRYADLLAVIKGIDASKVTVLKGSNTAVALGDGDLHVLAPAEYVSDDVNDEDAEARYARIHENCAVLKVGKDPAWVLITGDADLDAFKSHITDYHKEHLAAQVLDASHHGSRSFFMASEGDDPYKDHIEAISPAFVIVSAPKQSESRHDHPHDDAIKLYEECGAQVLHMGPKRECFICDIHDDGTIDDPVSDEGKLVESYGLSDDEGGDDGGGGGGGGGGKVEKRGPFVKPIAPAAPRDGRYA